MLTDFEHFSSIVGDINSRRKYHFPKEHPDFRTNEALEKIWLRATTQEGFPSICKTVSEQVSEELGFELYNGYFKADFGFLDPYGVYLPHWWCQEKDTIIDLTAAQFNQEMWPNNWVPQGVLIIPSNNQLHRRYVPGAYDNL